MKLAEKETGGKTIKFYQFKKTHGKHKGEWHTVNVDGIPLRFKYFENAMRFYEDIVYDSEKQCYKSKRSPN